ncbi:MAG: hypothetical protein NTU53_21895 [Planctomycetota bacterium]|nr:hypothetical protein [Planctomycetota bacterium]
MGMPCLLGCLALVTPRIVLALVWLFGGGYLGRAYHSVIWPLLGFVFLPLTTLAYAFAMNANHGSVSGIYLVIVVIAVLVDLGLTGGGEAGRRRHGRRIA